MTAGLIDCIDTPRQRNPRPEGASWCADNGCFSDRWDASEWWAWLSRQDPADCRFAVAPDVVGDAAATLARARPWLPRIRALGFPVAYVAQDGQETVPVPWDQVDCLFIGGTTEWKLGSAVRYLVTEAKCRGLWVHMGRVNSERRFRYAAAIGCDSADGTYLTFGPDRNLPSLLAWVRSVDQPSLFGNAS